MVKILRHDLNTPINAIFSYIDLIKLEPDLEAKYLSRLEAEVHYINNFISKSLEIVNYQQSVTLKEISLIDVIKEVRLFYPNHIQIEYDANQDIKINADRIKFIQLLINLIDNALKHGQASKIVFEIEKEPEVNKCRLNISNNGKKMESDSIENLTMKTFTKSNGQSGLGLMVVKNIVYAHAWNIKLETDPQTKFIIEFPLIG